MKSDQQYIAYTDGACSGNPGRGGWGAVILSPHGSVKEIGGSEDSTTNNKMELTAAIETLRIIKPQTQVLLLTDSSYVLNGITKWVWGWIKNNWQTSQGGEVSNKELWQGLMVQAQKHQVEWRYCRGHQGIAGNERADQIAVGFSKKDDPYLYFGKAKDYSISLHELPTFEEIPSMNGGGSNFNQKSAEKTPAYYVSYSNGVVKVHQDWASCQRSTQGISGAKYKKVKNQNEEIAALKSWGLDPEKIKNQKK